MTQYAKEIQMPDGNIISLDDSGGDEWEQIQEIPLSPDVSSYNLGKVSDWKKLRLIILRNQNTSLTGVTSVRIVGGGVIKLATNTYPNGAKIQLIEIEVNNLYQFIVKNIVSNSYQAVSNFQIGNLYGNGFGQGIDYKFEENDEYRFASVASASTCFDGTEQAILFGVRR